MKKVLEIKNLSYQNIIKSFNLVVNKGSLISVIGPNNSGKTILIKLISGIIPTTNMIIVNSLKLNKSNVNAYIKNIGVVLETVSNNFLYESVKEELMYPLINLNHTKKYSIKRIESILHLFKETKLLNKNISDLNLYDKKILSLVQSLLHKPKLLLIDNVFSDLTDNEKKRIFSILNILVDEHNLSIIYMTNNLNDIMLTDYCYIINKGEIVLKGVPLEVLGHDKLLSDIHLELPFMIDLSSKLKAYNLIDKKYFSVESMVKDLWK